MYLWEAIWSDTTYHRAADLYSYPHSATHYLYDLGENHLICLNCNWRGLCNSMKLWAMPRGATQDGWAVAEGSDKTWSTGGGNGKPPQNTCPENLMNCIKGQKDMTPKNESPSMKVFNMLLGKGIMTDFLFLGSKITADGDCSYEIRKRLLLDRKAMTNLDSVLKSRDVTLPTKAHLVSGHVQLWELDCKEGRTAKNWCLRTVVLEETPESPLESKEIKPVNLKGEQPWIVTGRTDAEAEAPAVWSSNANRWLIGEVPDAGKDQGQKEKRVSADEVAGQHHQCNEHELWQTLGDGEGQGGLWYCSPCGSKELDMTGQVNNSNNFGCTLCWIRGRAGEGTPLCTNLTRCQW